MKIHEQLAIQAMYDAQVRGQIVSPKTPASASLTTAVVEAVEDRQRRGRPRKAG
tara:strand:- start:1543 stop:1704 length:162 start_codon:yes stop_codon:yes gene_type:complete